VITWVNAHAARRPDDPPVPAADLAVNEYDELFTFVGDKKRSLHCDPGKPGQPLPWIVPARPPAVAQAMLDRSPQAHQYYSDGYPVYEALP